jgi:hypothetical protein
MWPLPLHAWIAKVLDYLETTRVGLFLITYLMSRNPSLWTMQADWGQVPSLMSPMESNPWTVPAEFQLSSMHKVYDRSRQFSTLRLSRLKPLKFYQSAASQAICLLATLQEADLIRLRQLVIREDHRSCARPECHAHGLGPFLKRFSEMCIEYRIDMWNAT